MSITPGKFKPSIQVLQIFQIMSTLGQGEGLDPTLLTHCPSFPSISKGCCVCVCGGGGVGGCISCSVMEHSQKLYQTVRKIVSFQRILYLVGHMSPPHFHQTVLLMYL